MQILYVSKEEIFPAFGTWDRNFNIIRIREDLPRYIQEALLWHEKHHAENTEVDEHWAEEELEANWRMFCKCPRGAIWLVFHSLFSWDRLKFYLERFKRKK